MPLNLIIHLLKSSSCGRCQKLTKTYAAFHPAKLNLQTPNVAKILKLLPQNFTKDQQSHLSININQQQGSSYARQKFLNMFLELTFCEVNGTQNEDHS